jgi:hypothetical protein
MDRGHIDRRSFQQHGQVAKGTHPASARLLDRLRTRFMFHISVDVTPAPATISHGSRSSGTSPILSPRSRAPE